MTALAKLPPRTDAIFQALSAEYWNQFGYSERRMAEEAAKAAGNENPDPLLLDELTAIVRHYLVEPDFVELAEAIERTVGAV